METADTVIRPQSELAWQHGLHRSRHPNLKRQEKRWLRCRLLRARTFNDGLITWNPEDFWIACKWIYLKDLWVILPSVLRLYWCNSQYYQLRIPLHTFQERPYTLHKGRMDTDIVQATKAIHKHGNREYMEDFESRARNRNSGEIMMETGRLLKGRK